MVRFHVFLHPASPLPIGRHVTVVEGVALEILDLDPAEAARCVFPVSFVEAAETLERLDRLALEPDGSFVWRYQGTEETWQVDGNLYDRADGLAHVELKGECPQRALDQMLSAFGWPRCAVIFQLARSGVFLDEATFRRWGQRPAVDY